MIGMIARILGIILSLLLVGLVAYISIPLRDAVLGVPFTAKELPDKLGDGWFHDELVVNCNRFYPREIGIMIEPPVPVESMVDANSTITGEVTLVISQDGQKWERHIELERTGWTISAGGIRLKVLSRFEPLTTPFCGRQRLVITGRNLNFDLERHSISIYVSRDRRP